MAIQQESSDTTYRCPRCDGTMTYEHQAWGCADCGHAPFHGAD